MEYIAQFFAGAFFCNCIPHLVCGVQGAPFPTPFAKPRGVGNSPPITNFFWGLFNLLVGVALLSVFPIIAGLNAGALSFLVGAVALGTYLSIHFGAVMEHKNGR